MALIFANGITLEYERIGGSQGPPVLLIMGLGAQLISWPDEFCEDIAKSGFQVIRFDNRDSGLSTKFEIAGKPSLLRATLAGMLGRRMKSPYTLADMALDTVGLMDSLGLGSAHLVGVSMGGMIAQIMAAKHKERVRSLTCLMSHTNDPKLPKPDLGLRLRLMFSRPKGGDREELIRYLMENARMVGSTHFPVSDSDLRRKIEQHMNRSHCPEGFGRQLLAIMASGSLVDFTKRITVPTLVIHGAADPLVPVEAGMDLAIRIRGATLKIFENMGHDLPLSLIPALAQEIVQHLQRAETKISDKAVGQSKDS